MMFGYAHGYIWGLISTARIGHGVDNYEREPFLQPV